MSLVSWIPPFALAYLGLQAWRKRVGDAKIVVRPELYREPKVYYYPGDTHALVSFRLAMKNTGTQQALVIDAHAHLQPAGNRFNDLQPVCRLINPEAPRVDGYWEASIVPVGQEVELEVRVHLTSADGIAARIAEMGCMRFDVHYKYYCRNPLAYCKKEIIIPVDAIAVSETPPAELVPPPSKKPPVDLEAPVVPLRTHLLRPGEDVLDIIERYAVPVGKPGDIVILAETAVAIMQGRLAYCEDIQPGFLARNLNVLFGMHSSLSSPYSMEMAIREVGVSRILLATAAGILGKVTRRPGDFYRLAGRSVAAIDDCTGTLPPFDKHVVMGPADGEKLVAQVRQKTGLECAIVDANDLGKVDIFHISDPSRSQEVVDALKPNPQGNAAEMTPLVLIRKQN